MTNWDEVDYYPEGLDQVARALTDTDGPPDVLSLWNWVFDDDVEGDSPIDTFLAGVWFGGERSERALAMGAFGLDPEKLDDQLDLDCAFEFMGRNPDDDDVVAARAVMARIIARSPRDRR